MKAHFRQTSYSLPGALFAVALCLPGIQGCFSSPSPQSSRSSASSGALNLDAIPSLPTNVDASKLVIADIVVAQFSNPKFAGAVQPLVDFSYSGSTDYVEVKTCIVSSGVCSPAKNLFETNSAIANTTEATQVVVKLRACVDPSRALGGTNCGPWFDKQYSQWAVPNKSKATLQADYEAIERDVKDLEKQMKDLLKLKADRATKCQPASEDAKALLESDKTLHQAIVKMGGGIVGAIGKKLTEAEPSKEQGDTGSTGTDTSTSTSTNTEVSGGFLPSDQLALTGGRSTEIITAQDAKYVSPIFRVIAGALEKKSRALKNLASKKQSKSLNIASSTNIPSSGFGEDTKTDTSTSTGTGTDTSTSSSTNTNTGSDKPSSEPAGEEAKDAAATVAKAAAGQKFSWDDIISELPNIADAIFDMNNADRKIALEGICIEKLGEKQSEAIQMAQSQLEQTVLRLRSRAQSIKAKLGDK